VWYGSNGDQLAERRGGKGGENPEGLVARLIACMYFRGQRHNRPRCADSKRKRGTLNHFAIEGGRFGTIEKLASASHAGAHNIIKGNGNSRLRRESNPKAGGRQWVRLGGGEGERGKSGYRYGEQATEGEEKSLLIHAAAKKRGKLAECPTDKTEKRACA